MQKVVSISCFLLMFLQITTGLSIVDLERNHCKNNYNCFSLMDTIDQELCSDSNVHVPNAFTPNGDGTNDTLLFDLHGMELIKFTVFNRWGEKVFETADIKIKWDGKMNNEYVKTGVYVYILEVKCPGKESINISGNLTLNR